MSQQEIEIPHEHIAHAKHAAHAGADGDDLARNVAVAVTIMAIVAATIGSLEETESAHALALKNEAVLFQTRASDQWAFFQAKSLKKNMYTIAAEEAVATGRSPAAFAAKADRYGAEEEDIQNKAKGLEQMSQHREDDSAHHTSRHHTLTLAATLVHVAIAISSLAIFTHRRLPLFGSIALAGAGVIVATLAYV